MVSKEMAVTKYEYYSFASENPEKEADRLNKYASEGWRLVNIQQQIVTKGVMPTIFFLERPQEKQECEQFEYTIYEIRGANHLSSAAMNDLGSQGWEMVAIVKPGIRGSTVEMVIATAFFKRKKQ